MPFGKSNLPPREKCYDPVKLKATMGAMHAMVLKNRLYDRYSAEEAPKDWEEEWQAWLMAKPKISRVIAQAVIDLFDGCAKSTAAAMGINSHTVSKLAADPVFRDIIMARKGKDIGPQIADRVSRQAFWSQIMQDEKSSMGDRLKASELLGKSFADFTDKQILEGRVVTVTDALKTLEARAERVVTALPKKEEPQALPAPEAKPEEITDDFLR